MTCGLAQTACAAQSEPAWTVRAPLRELPWLAMLWQACSAVKMQCNSSAAANLNTPAENQHRPYCGWLPPAAAAAAAAAADSEPAAEQGGAAEPRQPVYSGYQYFRGLVELEKLPGKLSEAWKWRSGGWYWCVTAVSFLLGFTHHQASMPSDTACSRRGCHCCRGQGGVAGVAGGALQPDVLWRERHLHVSGPLSCCAAGAGGCCRCCSCSGGAAGCAGTCSRV